MGFICMHAARSGRVYAQRFGGMRVAGQLGSEFLEGDGMCGEFRNEGMIGGAE